MPSPTIVGDCDDVQQGSNCNGGEIGSSFGSILDEEEMTSNGATSNGKVYKGQSGSMAQISFSIGNVQVHEWVTKSEAFARSLELSQRAAKAENDATPEAIAGKDLGRGGLYQHSGSLRCVIGVHRACQWFPFHKICP